MLLSGGLRYFAPAGVIDDGAEGATRQVRVWNSVGASTKSLQKFTIETGLPMLTSTTMDGFVWDRAETLTLRGYGFKSKTAGETQLSYFRVDEARPPLDEDAENMGNVGNRTS